MSSQETLLTERETEKLQFDEILFEMFKHLIENTIKISSVVDEIYANGLVNDKNTLTHQFIVDFESQWFSRFLTYFEKLFKNEKALYPHAKEGDLNYTKAIEPLARLFVARSKRRKAEFLESQTRESVQKVPRVPHTAV